MLGLLDQLNAKGNWIVVYHPVAPTLSCTRKYQVNCPDSVPVLAPTLTLQRSNPSGAPIPYPVIAIPYFLPVE
jgi:hypothetical protein